MKIRIVAVLLGFLMIGLCMASNDVIARATTFDSPPPLCPPGVTEYGCLPWRPTPPRMERDKEPKEPAPTPVLLPTAKAVKAPVIRMPRMRQWIAE